MGKYSEIDTSIFSELKSTIGEDFLAEMIVTFFDDSKQQTTLLKRALIDNNQDEFTRAAHSLKSTSLIFGALKFGELAREVEENGRGGFLAESEEKIKCLCDALDSLQTKLKDLCHG